MTGTCPVCSREFTKVNRLHRYCSLRCKRAAADKGRDRNGARRRRTKRPQAPPAVRLERLAEIRRLRSLGLTQVAIGRKVGLTGARVGQLLKTLALEDDR